MVTTPTSQVPMGLSVRQGGIPKRVARRPTHPFYVEHRPQELQPFMIAPVLPGETLKNLLFQSRAVTKPIKNPLVGWWLEHWFFYVPLRSLKDTSAGGLSESGNPTAPTAIEDMLLDLSAAKSNDGVTNTMLYERAEGANWMSLAYERVVNQFFRDQGESSFVIVDGTTDAARIHVKGNSWMDSLFAQSELPAGTNIDITSPAGDLTMQELDTKYQTWLMMRSQGMTEMTYEDYIASFGVKLKPVDELKPELLRYVSSWTYPTNTVNPADVIDNTGEEPVVIVKAGQPSSALSWSVSERADKDRFFREPGFIIGVTAARPKFYRDQQRGSISGMLQNAFDWMPAIMKEQVQTSIKYVAQGAGILSDVGTTDWVFDVRDLYLYGDQFVGQDSNGQTQFSGTYFPVPTQSAPEVSGGLHFTSKYANTSDLNDLFVDGSAIAGISQDGVVNLNILGTQMDHT